MSDNDTNDNGFSYLQIVNILSRYHQSEDSEVLRERKRVAEKFKSLELVPVWCPGYNSDGSRPGPGAMLLQDSIYYYDHARAWWLKTYLEERGFKNG